MNLATWSIRFPNPPILLFTLLTLAGLWGFRTLGVQDLPDLDLPTVKVDLREPGAAPAQLETEVARRVEDSMAKLTGIRHLQTQITAGKVSITASFALERNLSDALADAKDAVDRIRNDLPGDLEEPKITKVTIDQEAALATYVLRSDRLSEEQLSWLVDDQVAKAVVAVHGVGDFARVGGVQREVQVVVDPTRLSSRGVTAADVSRALRRSQQDASGGRGQLAGAELGVRTVASVALPADLAALPISLADGRAVRLDEVASVHDTIANRTQAALLDGTRVVGFQVWRTKGYDATQVAEGVRQAVARVQDAHPGLQSQVVSTTVDHTREQYQGSMHMLYEGALLAVAVIWLFLRDWRATLIGAVALPLSIIPAFAYMAWAGYTLNTVTLLALAVVVGILVDDAIVEVENVVRHVRSGKSVRQATEEAVNEIALAVLATTSTLVVVFLPTAFMGGVPGLVFKEFGWTIVVAVLLSFMVARLITPLMAVWLIKPAPPRVAPESRTLRSYLQLAAWCLDHRGATLTAALAVFAASVAMLHWIPTGFIPSSDRDTTTITVELPPGASLDAMSAVTERARQAIVGATGVVSVFTSVGDPGEPEAGEVRHAAMIVRLRERGHRPTQQAIEHALRERLQEVAGARFSLAGGGAGERVELILAGPDNAALNATARNVERELRSWGHLPSVTSTARLERQDVVIRPDPVRAAEQGVATAAIGDTVHVALSGDRSAALAKLNLDQRQLDIRVMVPERVRHDLDAIAALRVPGAHGLVALNAIARVDVESGLSEIDRYDRERQVTVSADLGGSALGDAIAAARQLPAIQARPTSVRLVESGDAETQVELFTGMRLAMVAGVLCVYAVLVLLFEDWLAPLTILSALPLSVGGAFAALLLTHSELNLPSLIGLVMLMGIVTKNSILIVDFALVRMQSGEERRAALLYACRHRAQAITMTTVAMICGMLPLALGFGADASFRQPMAIAVIGGLVSSTLMSLLVVPVAFTYVDGLSRLLRRSNSAAVPRRVCAPPTPSLHPPSPTELSP